MLLPEVKSRTQGSRPRPRTQKNLRPRPRTALPRGQGQECSRPRPRTQAQVFSKKRSSKIFSADLRKRKTKKVFAKFPRGFWRFPTLFYNGTNPYYCRNRCKCASHYMGNLQYKPSRRGSSSVLC